MSDYNGSNPYRDLEERTYKFAENCRDFTLKLPKTLQNFEYAKQLIRSSGSQTANYIEANEALSGKDRCFRLKICRKETRESKIWLRLCIINESELINERSRLIDESEQLGKIFSRLIQLNS